jgi:hypothetical protein
MVGIYNKIRKGLDFISNLNDKFGGAVDAFIGLPVSKVLGKVIPLVSTGADVVNNSYNDYKKDPKSFSLGGWLKNMACGKYFSKKKKPVVYSRPEELHPRIELSDDTTLALREPSGVVELD